MSQNYSLRLKVAANAVAANVAAIVAANVAAKPLAAVHVTHAF